MIAGTVFVVAVVALIVVTFSLLEKRKRHSAQHSALRAAFDAIEDYYVLKDMISELDDCSTTDEEWKELLDPCMHADKRRSELSRAVGLCIDFISLESIVLMKLTYGEKTRMIRIIK